MDAGAALGTVYDPTTYEVYQKATADRDGVLYALNQGAIVTAGDAVANVAEVDPDGSLA
ncbi:MAG: hypothetical protein ABEJ35_06480 [Halobacteriaceae archaeon]